MLCLGSRIATSATSIFKTSYIFGRATSTDRNKSQSPQNQLNMKIYHVCATLSLSVILWSFTPPSTPVAPSPRTGTYGVCGCGSTMATGPNISLALNNDGTFRYVNGTDRNDQVDVAGSWKIEKNKVSLKTASGEMFATWTMDKNTNCLRTRKGFLFTRLCHLDACK